jgi:hypothetical protein
MWLQNLTFIEKTTIKLVISVVAFGALGVCSGAMFLWYGEAWAAADALRAREGRKAVVRAEFARVSKENEGKLVHVAGTAEVTESLSDPDFLITEPAIKLRRIVEMYQWAEFKNVNRRNEKDPAFRYSGQWDRDIVYSTGFQSPDSPHNPNFFPWPTREWINPTLTFGAYRLDPAQVNMFSPQRRSFKAAEFEALPAELKDHAELKMGELYYRVEEWWPDAPADKVNPDFEPGRRGGPPSIGDLRVRFEIVRPGPITVVAQQRGNSFGPFPTPEGEIEAAKLGLHEPDEMFKGRFSSPVGNRIGSAMCMLVGWLIVLVAGAITFFTFGGIRPVMSVLLVCLALTVLLVGSVEVIAWARFDPIFAGVCGVIALNVVAAIAYVLRLMWRPPAPADGNEETAYRKTTN